MQFLRQADIEIKIMEQRVQKLQLEVAEKNERIQELRKKSKRSVKFDEETIAEHDKERGTRMKIDEPKTPYVREEPFSFPEQEKVGDDDDDDIPILNSAVVFTPGISVSVPRHEGAHENDEDEEVDAEASVPVKLPSPPAAPLGRPPMLDISVVESSLQEDKKKKDFEEARSKHYNEMERLKAWREKQQRLKEQGKDPDEEDDEEDEE